MGTLSNNEVLTTGQVARICHVAPRTVSKWFDSGKLRGYRIPGSRDRRIPKNHLVAFMEAYEIPLDELDGHSCKVMIFSPETPLELAAEFSDTDRFEVRIAENGFEAGVLAEQFRPDVIILDALGQADEAAAICQNIRGTADLHSAKIIAACADMTDEYAELLTRSGFDGCLSCPVTISQLSEVIDPAATLAG